MLSKRTLFRANLLLSLLFASVFLFSQKSLQGLKLGERNKENDMTAYIAGIKGRLMVFELNDGRAFQIGFAPTQDGKNISRLKKSAYDAIVNDLEKTYSIKFSRINSEKNDKDYILEATKNNVVYLVDVIFDPSNTFPYDIMFSMVDLDLEDIAIAEGK